MKLPRLLPWLVGLALFLAVLCLFHFANEPADRKQSQSAAAIGPHSNVIRVENADSRSRMMQANPGEIRLSPKDNAATDYRRAFELLEKLTPREWEIMDQKKSPQPPATDAEITALLDKIAPILAALEAGVAKPECDWDIRHIHPRTNLSFLTSAVKLGKIVLWDSAHRISDQPKSVVRHLQELSRLGNQMDVTIAGGLVNTTLHGQIHRFLGDHAAQVPAAIRQAYLAGTNSEALLASFRRAAASEEQANQSVIEVTRSGHHFDGSPLTDTEGSFLLQGNDKNKVLDQLEDYGRTLPKLSQSLFWSDSQMQDWQRRNLSAASFESVGESVIDYKTTLSIRENMRAALVQQEMARAGMSILNNGPSALAQFLDPITGQPFRYRTTDAQGSFALESTVLRKGKPVSLTFRRGELSESPTP